MTWEIFGLSVPTIQEYVNKMVYNLSIYLFKMVVILRKMTFIKIMFINNNYRPILFKFNFAITFLSDISGSKEKLFCSTSI